MTIAKRLLSLVGFILGMWWGTGVTTCYAVSFNISVDTTSLIGHPAGPFSLEFQLTDGSGLDDANNTATLSGFNFGSGGATGSPTLLGEANGDLGTSVTLTDSGFLNQFLQQFTPGNMLNFALALTTNVDVGPQPDLFSFSILDSTGSEIPTLAGFVNAFALVNLDSAAPTLQIFASDTTHAPAAGGDPIVISQPQVETVVPEPSTLMLLGSGTIGFVLIRKGRTRFGLRLRGHDNASRRFFASCKSPVVKPSVNHS